MRRAVLFAALLAACAPLTLPAPPAAAEQGRREAALDLLEAMDMEAKIETSLAQVVEMQIKRNSGWEAHREVVHEFFEQFMGWEKMREEYVAAFGITFTDEELRQVAAFYRTPAGRKAFELLPQIRGEMAKRSWAAVMKNRKHLQERIAALTAEGEPEEEGEQEPSE